MLRPATIHDIADIFPLLDMIWEDMAFPFRQLVDASTFQTTMMALMATNRSKYSMQNCYVYTKNDTVVGVLLGYFGHLEMQLDAEFYAYIDQKFPELSIRQYAFNRETTDKEWYIDALVVHAHYRKQGIGRAFFNYLPTLLPVNTTVGLNCDFDNPKAKKLYQSLGFETTQIISFLGHDYYHMQKMIGTE